MNLTCAAFGSGGVFQAERCETALDIPGEGVKDTLLMSALHGPITRKGMVLLQTGDQLSGPRCSIIRERYLAFFVVKVYT